MAIIGKKGGAFRLVKETTAQSEMRLCSLDYIRIGAGEGKEPSS